MTLEEAILKATSDVTGVEIEKICSIGRQRAVATSRQIACYIYHRVYFMPVTLKQTAPKLFRGMKQDHSTIIHAINKAEEFMCVEPEFRRMVKEVRENIDKYLFDYTPTEPVESIVIKMLDLMPYNNCASF